jgi:hypothetical protein
VEYDQSNPNYQQPIEKKLYNPENAQQDSLGVHPSEKKKEAIAPNLLQPESPHKNLPPELKRSNPNPNAPELPDKFKASKKFTFEKPSEEDTDPNAPKLPVKFKESKKFTFEKPSEKDADPNAPKLPDKFKHVKKFTFEKPSEKDIDPELQALNAPAKAPDINPAQEPLMQQATPIPEQRSPLTAPSLPLETVQADRSAASPILWSHNPEPQFRQNQEPDPIGGAEQPMEPIALAPAIAVGVGIPDIQIAQNAATLNPGANAIAGKAFNIFLRDQLKKRVPALAATMTGVATLDGPLPIGDALALGLSVDTLWQIHQEWVKLQTPKASSADPAQSDPQSNAAPAGLRDSTFNRPIDLGNVPQMGSTPDGTQAFLEAQKAQMAQQEQQLKAKWNREMQLAVSATHRRQQRDAVDDAIGDKLYKVEQKENLGLYQEWLLQNDPKWLDKMNRQSEGRYDTLSDSGKDFQFEGEESKRSFKQQLLSHTMYQSDIRARETIEYSAMELNLDNVTNQGIGFNPKKLVQIRTNFDAVAEGRYEKKLEPKVMRYVETQADAAYRKETNSKEADRNSTLWKTLRNVELLKYDRTLWNTVQEPAAGTDVSKTMTDQSNNPDLGANALNRHGQPLNRDRLTQPETFPTGAGQKPQQPVGGGFDTTANPELMKPLEGFPTNQPVDGVTNVHQTKSEPNPADRLQHEEYLRSLRQQMGRPHIEDSELNNFVGELYRPGASIGSGSTADAIRHERNTGQLVKGKEHTEKGMNAIRYLEKWLKKNPTARPGDRAAAENILRDLKNALELE